MEIIYSSLAWSLYISWKYVFVYLSQYTQNCVISVKVIILENGNKDLSLNF